ncbi:unnamed protein product, partial [marine sediment metagenome]
MPESEDVGDRRVGSKDGEIFRLPTAAEGQVLVMGDDGWEAGEAAGVAEVGTVTAIVDNVATVLLESGVVVEARIIT